MAPTSSPTFDVYDYTNRTIYQDYLKQTMLSRNSSSSIVFGTFSYKGSIVDGTCPTWKDYTNAATRLPFDDIYFSNLKVYSAALNIRTDSIFTNGAECSDPAILKQLIYSLNNGLSFNQICGTQRFRVEVCPDIGTSMCVNCNNVCKADRCNEAYDVSTIFVNPCLKCNAYKALYQILDLRFDRRILFPRVVAPIVATASRHAMQLTVNISAPGHVYCYAAPAPFVPTSGISIKQMGVENVYFQGGVHQLSLTNLNPSTDYDVYCYTEDFSTHVMDLKSVVKTYLRVRTACCPQVVFDRYYPQIRESSTAGSAVAPSVFRFRLDASNVLGAVVQVSIAPNTSGSCIYSTTAASAATVQPSRFALGNATSGSFVVYGTPGCYVLTTSLTSSAQSTPVPSSSALSVLSASAAFAPPLLLSAQISNDGLRMIVFFDSTTDRGGSKIEKYDGSFKCHKLLSFEQDSQSDCVWLADNQVQVTFAASDRNVVVGDTVSIRQKSLRSGFCATSSSCEYSPSSSFVLVLAPSQPVLPTPAVTASREISACDDIIVDPTNSIGSGGRSWVSVQWFVEFTSVPSGTTVDYIARAASIASMLNADYSSTRVFATVPNRLLATGTVQFTLRLANYLGGVSQASVQTVILPATVAPSVTIGGPRLILMPRSQQVFLRAAAKVPVCAGAISPALTYTWMLYSGTTFITSLQSVAQDQQNFILNPFTLSPLILYTVQVVVAPTAGGTQVSANVKLQVVSGGVVARIAGGTYRRVGALSSVLLDASASYDVDYPTNSQALSYAWSCVDISTDTYGDACQVGTLASTASFSVTLDAYAGVTVPRKLLFAVVATNAGGVSANTTTILEIYSQFVIPSISMLPSRVKYNVNDKIIVSGFLSASERATLSWSIPQLPLANTTGVFLTPARSTVPIGRTLFQQALSSNALQAGVPYTLRLLASYPGDTTLTAYAEVLILMNEPPAGGSLAVTPSVGYELNTTYLFQTFDWTDAGGDLPLTFSFQYYTLPSLPRKLFKANNNFRFASGMLGRGLESSGYNITGVAIAYDALGSSATTSRSGVTVFPMLDATAAFVGQKMASALDAAFVVRDPIQVSQIVTAVSTYLNAVNCSSVSPAFCSSLNRESCAYTAHTCGACLSGFVGILGDTNRPCFNSSSSALLLSIGSTCNSDTQCLSGVCSFDKCVAAPKPCPNDCSNAGACVYTNYSGSVISNCADSDSFCYATCTCDAGRFGRDCSLDSSDFAEFRAMRERLCHSVQLATTFQDVTEDVLLDRGQLLSNLLVDPNQVSLSALFNCSAALTSSVGAHAELVGTDEVASLYVEALSNVLDSNSLPEAIVSDLNGAYQSLATGVQANLAIGEKMSSFKSKNVRFGAVLLGVNNTDSLQSDLAVPQSELEVLQGSATTSLVVNVRGGVAKDKGGIGVTVFQYNKNFLGSDVASASVGFQTKAVDIVNEIDTTGTPGRRQLVTDTETADVVVDVKLQNIAPIEYFETVPEVGIVDCLRTGVPHNVTLNCSSEVDYLFECPGVYGQRFNYSCPIYTMTPFCTAWNGTLFSDADECEVYAFDASSTVCRCAPSPEGTRRLAAGDTSLEQFASVARVVVTPFVQLIDYLGPKGVPEIEYDQTVVVLMSIILGAWILLLLWLLYTEHAYVAALFKSNDDSAVVSPQYHGRASAVLALNYSFPLHEEGATKLATGAAAYEDHSSSSKKMKYIAIDTFFNALLPKELTGLPWYRRLGERLFTEHNWLSLFQGQTHLPPKSDPQAMAVFQKKDTWAHTSDTHHDIKSLRWLLVMGRVINFLFFTTLFVTSFYSDDGTCEDAALREDCLSYRGLFNLGHMCLWEPTLDTACTFNKLNFDNVLSLLVVAVVVTVVSLPFDHLFYFVIVKVKLSTTDVASMYLKAVIAKTHRQVEPLRVKNVPVVEAHATQAHNSKGGKKSRVHPHNPAAPAFPSSPTHAHNEDHHHYHHAHVVHAGTSFYARHNELSSVMHHRSRYLRAARLILLQAKTDRISSRKEIHGLLNDIHTGEVRLRVKPTQVFTLHMLYKRLERACMAGARTAYSYALGRGAIEVAPFRDNVDEDTIQYVTDEVKRGRSEAKLLKRTLGALISDVDKEAFLIQYFLVSCLPPVQRRIASLYLFRKVELSKIGLSNYALYAMLAVLMAYLIFAVVYIYLVGTTIGTRASTQWLIVIGICFAYDLLVLQPLKIWMKFVAVASVASSELRIYHAMLKERARFILTRMHGVVRNYNQMLHHCNPACRAARTFPELAASRLLISLNDADLPVHLWRDRRLTLSNGLQWLLQSVLYVFLSPLLVLPAVTHEFSIELFTTCCINLALIGLVLLARVNVFIPIGISIGIVAGIVLSCLFIWRTQARRQVSVMSSRVMDDNGMMSDDLDQPVVAEFNDLTVAKRNAVFKELQLKIEAEEYTLLKDGRKKISMKNHLKEKGELYEKLIAKYKLKHERAALAQEYRGDDDNNDSGAHLPLFDFAPGEIATPFKVRPFDVASPRDEPAPLSEEAKDELLTPRKENQKLSSVPVVYTKDDRYVPRHIRRERELSKKRKEEEKQLKAETDFAIEFGGQSARGDQHDEEYEDFNVPVRWGQQGALGSRKKPTPAPPVHDLASVAAILEKHDLVNAVTTRKPIARPAPHEIRIPREIQRRRLEEKLNKMRKEEEEQRRQDDSFSLNFGDSDEEAAPEEKKEATENEMNFDAAKKSGKAVTPAAVAQLTRNLRSMKIAARRKRQLEAEQAEARRMKESEESFDMNELLFGDDNDLDDANANESKERNVEQMYRSGQLRAGGSSTLSRRPVTAGSADAASAAARLSRAAALDAAQRSANIDRLNRVIAMNNFVKGNSPMKSVGGGITSPVRPAPVQLTRPLTAQAPSSSATAEKSDIAGTRGAASAGPVRNPLLLNAQRHEARRVRQEQDRKRREEDEPPDWEMVNDDLFEQEASDDLDGSDA